MVVCHLKIDLLLGRVRQQILGCHSRTVDRCYFVFTARNKERLLWDVFASSSLLSKECQLLLSYSRKNVLHVCRLLSKHEKSFGYEALTFVRLYGGIIAS